MNNYSYRVTWSDEDHCYIATSPTFPRLSAFGDSAQEALSELSVVLEAALEIYADEGWSLPEPQKLPSYSGQFRLRLPKSLHAGMAEQAEREGVSLNTLVVQYLAEGLEGSTNRTWIQQELRLAATWFLGVVRGVFAASWHSDSTTFTQPPELKGEPRLVSSKRSTGSETFDLAPEPVRYH
jgi:predicted HicB family RNase H-like nuclease